MLFGHHFSTKSRIGLNFFEQEFTSCFEVFLPRNFEIRATGLKGFSLRFVDTFCTFKMVEHFLEVVLLADRGGLFEAGEERRQLLRQLVSRSSKTFLATRKSRLTVQPWLD